MTFLSYAQNYEDVRLWRAFRNVEEGRYIDVGGQDPVRDSVSLAFYERGWRGIHVEPTPTYAEALRNARPEETIIEAAVTTAPGPIRFFDIPSTGLSTGIAEIAKQHGSSGWDYREILVPTVTLAGIFKTYGPELVHWLKIDVEGMEADVIASWGDHPARPAVLVIEATAPMTQTKTHSAWRQMVLDRGYSDVVFDGLSRFFVHKDHKHLRQPIAESPNVFDGFHVSDTHFTAARLVNDRHEAVAAVNADLQSRLDAVEAAATSEIARLLAEHETDQNCLSDTQGELSATSQRLAVTEGELSATSQRLAVTEGELSTTSQRLAVTEGELSTTSQRLAVTETALSLTAERVAAAEGRLAEATCRLDALRHEHGQLLRKAGYLQGQLETSVEAHAERLADTTAQLNRAEQDLRSANAELGRAKDEIALMLSVQLSLERRLQRAGALLANAPDPYQRLSSFRGTLIRWLMPRSAVIDCARHGAEVSQFQSDVSLMAIPAEAGGANSVPPAPQTIPNTGSNSGGFMMNESDEPITTVPRLLEPHDRHFIHTAYQSLLGRAPDPEGERYYLARLRAGTHKLVILRQLRRSPEGRAFIPGVAGLDRAIKRHRQANLPLIGWIIRWLTNAAGNGATHRQLRIVANDIGRLHVTQIELTAEFDHLLAKLNEIDRNIARPAAAACDSELQDARSLTEQATSAFPLANTKINKLVSYYISRL
jgi:FkbM family methyltransferase